MPSPPGPGLLCTRQFIHVLLITSRWMDTHPDINSRQIWDRGQEYEGGIDKEEEEE